MDAKTGQNWVNYNGFLKAHGLKPDESDYYPEITRHLEFDQVFPIHGQIIFAELSLRENPDTGFPTMIDRICQVHDENPDEVSWICFSQIIDYFPFQGTLPSYFDMGQLSLVNLPSPGIMLYLGRDPTKFPNEGAINVLPRALGDIYTRKEFEDGVLLQDLRPRHMMPLFGQARGSNFGFSWTPY